MFVEVEGTNLIVVSYCYSWYKYNAFWSNFAVTIMERQNFAN